MKGPYTTTIRTDDGAATVLDVEVGGFQTLADHLRFAHLRAAEWVMAEVVDRCRMDTIDAGGTLVRSHAVYTADGGRLANSIVRERLS